MQNARKFTISAIEGFADNPIADKLASYTSTDKETIQDHLTLLDASNKKNLAKVLPAGIVPIYLSPLDPEKQALETATWTQYSEVGPYSSFDDGYCRPDETKPASWVYPRRDPETMLIDLAPCDKLINDDVKEMSKISNFLPGLLEISQVKLLELAASDNIKRLRSTTEELLMEYDKLQDQHIQLTKLLETNMDLINRRRKIINGLESSVDKKENDYNIKREIIMDDINNAKVWDAKLSRYYFYMKILGAIFIAITVMLVLLIDIGKIL